MAGYSGTPLVKKLGIKPGHVVYVVSPPGNYARLLGPLPDTTRIVRQLRERPDVVHVFSTDRGELERLLARLRERIAQEGMIWVSWPKKGSGMASTVSEDVIRRIALPLGLVDTKVCAVDEVWSGLKLVIRLEYRQKEPA